jgi:hypothetical protein
MATPRYLWITSLGACLFLSLGCRHSVQTAADGRYLAVPSDPAHFPAATPFASTGSPYHPIVHPSAPAGQSEFAGTKPPEATVPDPPAPPATAPPAVATPHSVAAPPPAKPAEGPPLIEALRCLLQKRNTEARQWLERFEAPNRELLSGLLVLAVRLSEEHVQQANPQDVAAIIKEMDDMQEPLRLHAALTISKMRFCKWIEKYGDYDPLPESHAFRAGELVQVYVELRNFTCARQGPAYLTRLASTLEIRDANGKIVWRHDCNDRDRPERSHTPLRDYFRNYGFYVPETIPPGLYTLRLQVTDIPTGRVARSSLDFRITTVPPRGL